jgi:hypothetical protein
MRLRWKILLGISAFLLLCGIGIALLAWKETPETITYGMSFNVPYARELGLDENEVFDAILNDLGVRNLRLAAHWDLIEPERGTYDFSWMDTDIHKSEAAGAQVIFGVGRRLPRWPECHVPEWAQSLSWEDQKKEILSYIQETVLRYKDSPAIIYWQVENEPFLEVFAHDHCGDLDEDFLKQEIALVRELDPSRPVLITDSGNLGTWSGAYRAGDLFGTSVYVYFWNPELGQFRTVLPPWFYRVKEHLMGLLFGEKKTLLIELSLEPWLIESVEDVPLETQFERMDLTKMDEILAYARKTGFDQQYLWGAEWWYWLKKQGHPEFWERGKEIFQK